MTAGQTPAGLWAVWFAFLHGEIAFPEALTRARAPDVVATLDAGEVGSIADAGKDFERAGQALAAVHGYELLIAGLEAHAPSDWQTVTLRRARISAMAAAKTALTDVPDGVLFRWALAQAQDELNGSTDDAVIGEMSFQSGALNLDPYIAGRTLTTRDAYDESIRLWKLRLEQRLGDRYADVADAVRMPEPQDALAAADDWFRNAIAHQPEGDRGLGIKALLQTIQARHALFDLPVIDEEIERLVADALHVLDPKTQAVAYAGVLKMALQFGRHVDPATVEVLLQPSLTAVAANLALGQAHELVTEVVQIVATVDPRRALDLFAEARPLLNFGVEENLGDFLMLALRTMRAAVPATLAVRLRAGTDTAADRAWLDTQPASDETAVACAYVLLAFLALPRCQEPDGRACVARVRERAPAFAARHREALDLLEVKLVDGWAVDARDAGAYGDAVTRFGEAVALAVRAGLIEEAFSELAFLEQLALRYRTAEALDAAARALSDAGLLLQAAAGDRGLWAVVTLAQAVLAMLLERDDAATPTIALLVQTVKGARFASELAAHVPYAEAADPDAVEQLQRIAAVAVEAGGDILGNASVDIDEEALLGVYIRRFDGGAGATAAERLANLQHRFDAHVDDELLPLASAQAQTLTPDALRGCIDEDTVVLDLYLDVDASGARTSLALASTRAETQVVRNADAGTGPIGDQVGALRRSVVQYTPVGLVDPDAQQQLATDATTLFGVPLLAALAAHHAAGRRHLRIVPHGALHFYPLHLLGPVAAPLADDWTVTYLPNLQLARPLRAPADAPRVAIGLSFANDPVLPPLTSSIAETTAVAQVFGTAPIVDGAATKARVLDALGHARYVHLSTHGKHNVVAPAFQCLYVAGNGSADRIFAYELLALDLRGLEVLTLSACETALGRFDRGDNVRGLPGSLLLAGVHAIVGTLWPVASAATATFFPAFYTALRPGVRVRDAFRAAQIACRTAHPKYAHWGAFYLIDRTA